VGRSDDAIAIGEEALATMEGCFGEDHRTHLVRVMVANIHRDHGHFARARELYQKVLNFEIRSMASYDPFPLMTRIDLARCLERLGEWKNSGGRYQEAAVCMERSGRTDRLTLYDIACLHAHASQCYAKITDDPASEDLTCQQQDQAVESFATAVDAGLRDPVHVARDPDLDTVRNRPDFQRSFVKLLDRFMPRNPFTP